MKAIDKSQRHIGILHKGTESEEVLLLHLAWHHDLRNHPPSVDYIWIDPDIHPARARQVSAFCRMVWRQNKKRIPYAFSVPNDCFGASTGRFLFGDSRFGLTCSTFVIAVFQATGLYMLELDSWPTRPDDAVWQQQIIAALQKTGADPAHIAILTQEIGAVRFRPEEVGGAAAHAPWPARFEVASSIARLILRLLDSSEEQ